MNLNSNSKNTIILKMIAIGFLALILLIPTSMISGLIQEREQRRNSAIDEVSSKWGQPQTLAGPVLTVPYTKLVETTINAGDKPQVQELTFYAHFLPDKLAITGKIEPEILQRGIYKVVAYNSQTEFSGEFSAPDIKAIDSDVKTVKWENSIVTIGIPDMRGIKEGIKIKWDGTDRDTKPGLGTDLMATQGINTGVNSKVSLQSASSTKKYPFSFKLNVNGSKSLSFLPLGNETNVELTSAWQTPSFNGAFLPDKREISQAGFTADWKVLQLNRNFPQSWTGLIDNNLLDSGFGVSLLVPVDEYQKNMRSVKYAILIISLTFLIFFFVEVMNRIRIHPIQYILVGLSLVLFFSLLLSISEYLNFNLAYLVASVTTILTVAFYSKNIFKDTKLSLLQSGILTIIYLFMFTIIQLQDYALLVGNIGLFIILIIVMFISRKINWYEIGNKSITD